MAGALHDAVDRAAAASGDVGRENSQLVWLIDRIPENRIGKLPATV